MRVVGTGWSDLACICPAGSRGTIGKHAAAVAAAISRGLSPIRPVAAPSDAGLQECYGTVAVH